MIKKGLSVFLALCMVLTLLPGTVWATETGSESSKRFVIENGVLTKYTLYDFNSESSSFRPLDVTEEQKACVEIPNGVTAIGESVFLDRSEIREIRIPSSVTQIGDTAFAKCSGLKKVIIPDTVTNIGKSVFLSCSALTDVTIPHGLTSIPYSMFNSCDSLEDITIPDNITSIEQYAFHGCKSLSKVTIPNSVTSIGREAFANCSKLASVALPNSLKTIQSGAFSGCSSLSEITIPDSVTNLESSVFRNCTGMTSIAIPRSVTIPGSSLFSGCTGLKEVIFPENFQHITIGMFYECTGLTQMTIPETVVSISENAFANCTGLTSITIPDSVTSIGNNAFCNCTGLTSVFVPASLNQSRIMGYGIFSGCTGLTSATLEDGMTYTGLRTFQDCTGLTSITIPASLETVNNYAFEGCTNLKDVYYAGTEEQWNAIALGTSNEPLTNAAIHYNSGSDTPEIPDTPVSPTGDPKILTLSPDSGAEFPGTVFDITFDREIAERTSNQNSPEVDLTLEAPFQIHRASDDSVVYTPNTYSWPQFTYGPSKSVLRISPNYSSTNGGTLVPGEQYYITMGAGFVKFTDGKTSPEIKKGEWTFTVTWNSDFSADPVITIGTNVDSRPNASIRTQWKDAWFRESAKTYNHELARTALALSGAAYGDGSAEPSPGNLTSALTEYGFNNDDIATYNYDSAYYHKLADHDQDHVGYAIASKPIAQGTVPTYLVAIVVKGTSGNNEWRSNFNMGTGDTHAGFSAAAEEIIRSLNSYLEKAGINAASARFLVTGHSRGAAVANLVAASLTGAGQTARERVYGYTFATPMVSTGGTEIGYENIFNIISAEDFVTRVPLSYWKFDHYGIDFLLPSKSYTSPSSYEKMGSAMESIYHGLVNVDWEKYSKGTQEVDKVISAMADLVPTLRDYYNTQHYIDYSLLEKNTTADDYFTQLSGYLAKEINTADFGIFATQTLLGDFKPLTSFFMGNFLPHNRIIGAHGVATYYSWLATDTAPEDLYAVRLSSSTNRQFKRVIISCPVDVYVYDEAGTVVASVVNEAVTKDTLAVTVEDGVKTVDLPCDQNYSVRIVARENGTVRYEVTELTAQGTGDNTTRTVTFNEIAITQNDVLTGNINDTAATPVGNYTLTKTTESGVTTTIPAASDTLPGNPSPNPGGSNSSGGSSSGRGGSSSSNNVYSISVPSNITGGKVTVSPAKANKGKTVTITVTLNENYVLNRLTVKDSKGTELSLTDKGNGKYDFTMPGSKVTVDADIVSSSNSSQKNAFTDVQPDAYFCDAVNWAVTQGVTNGTTSTTFSPDNPCTRAQIVTFLWRAAGSPKADGSNPFTDVDTGSYYYDAVQWAVAQGVTTGTTDTTFSPDNACTRAQAVTFLYRSKQVESNSITSASQNPFTDVNPNSYYANAVQWAVDNGITSGMTSSTFSPNTTCTRAQIVTFLYRSQIN